MALGIVLSAAAVTAQTPPATGSSGSVGPRPGAASAMPGEGSSAPRLLVFRFEHQRASEALATVRGMLSPSGSVSLDEASNTLSVRESPAILARISTAVRTIDHVALPVSLSVELIRAQVSSLSPVPQASDLDADLLDKLRKLFRFQYFALLSRGRIESRERESVLYEMGGDFRLSFEVGPIADGRRLRLSAFHLVRRSNGATDRTLVRTAVNLAAGQPLILGLTSDEASERALMLVLRYDVPTHGN